MSTAPRLLSGILGLDPLTRERLSHLHVDTATPQVTFWTYGQEQPALTGDLDAATPVGEQLDELEAFGLLGGLRRERVPGAGEHLLRVELWSATAKERAAWLKRMEAASTPSADELLAAGGQLRLAQLRRDQALAHVIARARVGDEQQIPRRTLAVLAQISPQTLYQGLNAPAPQNETATSENRRQPPQAQSTPQPATPSSGEPATAADDGGHKPSPAHFDERAATSDDLVRMPVGHTQMCVICRTPATHTLGGIPVHRGECLRQLREDPDRAHQSEAAAQSPVVVDQQPTTPEKPAPAASLAPGPASRQRSRRPSGARSRSGRDFDGLIAALNATDVFLPTGDTEPWTARHLGDIALLAPRYRLGGPGRRVQKGELWLWPGALERLGLPVEVDLNLEGNFAARREQREQILEPLNETPAVAAALEDGWTIGQGWLGPRTHLKHPELLPQGATIVIPTWSDFAGIPVLTKGSENEQDQRTLARPAVVVDRVNELATWTGVGFRLTPGVTGLDSIDYHRPPRWPGDGIRDKGRAAAVMINEPAELPPWLEEGDARLSSIERDFSYWRQMAALTTEEQEMEWVHAYDHRSHYLNPWSSTLLGIEGLRHQRGAAAAWDGTEKPGYFLLEATDWATWWQDWRYPDPLSGTAGFVENPDGPGRRRWVTSHTLKQLHKIDEHLPETLEILESYTWSEPAKYLDKIGAALAEGRATASPEVADTIKQIYSATTRKLGQLDGKPVVHLWRPDWSDHLRGASRTAIINELIKMQTRAALPDSPPTSPHALVVDRDTIILASNDPNPETAWIGDPGKLNSRKGGWRPTGTARLQDWAPEALKGDYRSGSTWRYVEHMDRMSEPGSLS